LLIAFSPDRAGETGGVAHAGEGRDAAVAGHGKLGRNMEPVDSVSIRQSRAVVFSRFGTAEGLRAATDDHGQNADVFNTTLPCRGVAAELALKGAS
jgi:hypothetical protein